MPKMPTAAQIKNLLKSKTSVGAITGALSGGGLGAAKGYQDEKLNREAKRELPKGHGAIGQGILGAVQGGLLGAVIGNHSAFMKGPAGQKLKNEAGYAHEVLKAKAPDFQKSPLRRALGGAAISGGFSALGAWNEDKDAKKNRKWPEHFGAQPARRNVFLHGLQGALTGAAGGYLWGSAKKDSGLVQTIEEGKARTIPSSELKNAYKKIWMDRLKETDGNIKIPGKIKLKITKERFEEVAERLGRLEAKEHTFSERAKTWANRSSRRITEDGKIRENIFKNFGSRQEARKFFNKRVRETHPDSIKARFNRNASEAELKQYRDLVDDWDRYDNITKLIPVFDAPSGKKALPPRTKTSAAQIQFLINELYRRS